MGKIKIVGSRQYGSGPDTSCIVDKRDQALRITETDRSKTHDGLMFNISKRIDSLANNGTFSVLIDSTDFGPNDSGELSGSFRVDGDCNLDIWTNPVISSNGSNYPVVKNVNDFAVAKGIATNTPIMRSYVNPTVSSLGEEKYHEDIIPGGDVPFSPGYIGLYLPMIIAPMTKRLFVLTNKSGEPIRCSVHMIYSEIIVP